MATGIAYLIALADSVVLLCISVFTLINLSDLNSNIINARVCCKRLNKIVFPEIFVSALTCLVFVYYAHFWPLLLSLPPLIWAIYARMSSASSGHMDLYDPAEIVSRNEVKSHLIVSVIKMVAMLTSVFVYLFMFIFSIL